MTTIPATLISTCTLFFSEHHRLEKARPSPSSCLRALLPPLGTFSPAMLSALFHPRRHRKTKSSSNFSSVFETSPGIADGSDEDNEAAPDGLENEDADPNAHTPLLPIFAAHLGMPKYAATKHNGHN